MCPILSSDGRIRECESTCEWRTSTRKCAIKVLAEEVTTLGDLSDDLRSVLKALGEIQGALGLLWEKGN